MFYSPSLSDLGRFTPEVTSIHSTSKSNVVPMKILFKDEKYKAETIDILTQILNDAYLSGDNQICDMKSN